MKKTILSLAVATTLGLTIGAAQATEFDRDTREGHNGTTLAEKAKSVMGGEFALTPKQKEAYLAIFTSELALVHKVSVAKSMIANNATTRDVIKYLEGNEEFKKQYPDLFDVDGGMTEEGKALVETKRNAKWSETTGDGYTNLAAQVNAMADADRKQEVINMLASLETNTGKSLLDDMKANGKLEDAEPTETIDIGAILDQKELELRNKYGAPVIDPIDIPTPLPVVEPLTRDEIAAYIADNKESRDIDSHTEAQAALDFITTYTGNGKVVELSKDGQTITVDGTEYTIEKAKEFIKAEAVKRSHNDDLLDPILDPIDPVEPIAGNPDAIKAYAKEAAIKWKNDLTDMQKRGVMEAAANRQGFEFETYENANGETIIKLTSEVNGVELGFTAEQFNDYMLVKHEERKGERQLRKTPELRDTKLREAVDTLWDSGQNLAVVGQESKAKLQAGAQGIKAGTEDLTEAGQTLKTDLTAGKAELEAAAQTATEQMAAQFAAMQAQLDEQAKLIAELQAGENPSVPSTGISPEAESALRDASATLQAKMDVAVNKLQGAAKTLQEKGSKLAPQDPDFGINPPSQGVPTHELGSIGEGQAVAYVQNGLEELYNTGNEQAQQYADKALSDAKSYTDTQIAGINSRIDGIEEDLETVMATSQAVTAARPYLSSNQTNAIGVGLGNSGSQNAIAVGYAHRINENWTANANLSGTSGNEVDYSVGAGLSYAW